MRILVVEDEAALRSFLVPRLQREGWQVQAVDTGALALAAVRDRPPDLVVLDVGLPDLSGLDVCRELRRQPGYLPVLMLTGLDSTEDELAGFAAQADDYVTKPVQPDMLVARLRALLRRSGSAARADRVWLGDVEVDLRLRVARRAGVDLALQPREFDLLAFLLEHPGQVFGRTQLLAHVWPGDTDVDVHAVTARVSRLRARVEPNPNRPRYLLTRGGVGYYLHLPAADADAASASASGSASPSTSAPAASGAHPGRPVAAAPPAPAGRHPLAARRPPPVRHGADTATPGGPTARSGRAGAARIDGAAPDRPTLGPPRGGGAAGRGDATGEGWSW